MKTRVTWDNWVWVDDDDFPLRTNSPVLEGTLKDLLSLSTHQMREMCAAHEAGHAVAFLHLPCPRRLHHLWIPDEYEISLNSYIRGETQIEGSYEEDGWPHVVALAAGERASDRWLREKGLWTPQSSVANEILAQSDRDYAVKIYPDLTFGYGGVDYGVAHDEADRLLEKTWAYVLKGIPPLLRGGFVWGDLFCREIGLTNPSE